MKKLIIFLFSLFAFSVVSLHAADLNDLTYVVTNGEVSITDCKTTASGQLIIPETINGNPVTSIGPGAFGECENLTGITLPESVNKIEDFAFYSCRGLTSFIIPENVSKIGELAFYDCISLIDIILPDSLETIDEACFEDCVSLRSINIPTGVTRVGRSAFYDCKSLVSIDLSGINRISPFLFYGCTNLKNVILPKNITVPQGVSNNDKGIGEHAFRDCVSLTGNLTIPEGVIKIGNSAFHNCAGLTGVIIPDTCTTIYEATFKGCSNLETVIFGENSQFRDFSPEAFKDCTSLKEITLYNLVSMGPSCFMNCTSLTRVQINSDRLARIYEFAFAGCTELKEINIPTKSLLYFNVFNDCSNLSKIYFDGGLPDIRGDQSFENRVAPNALAIVSYEDLPLFGGYGANWYSLTVTINNSSVGKVFEALDAVLADRDGKIETINQLQATVEANNSTITELEKRPTAEQLSTAIAQRDARPTQEAYDVVVAERDSKIESINQLQATVEANNSTITELEKRPTAEQLSTAIAQRDARPTQEAYDVVVSERDARPTADELQDARNGSVVINSSNGEVIISFNIEESEDLKTWQATGEKITKTIQLKDGKKFYRFALDK